MTIVKFLIPVILVILVFLLIRYDRNADKKNKNIAWLSRSLFRDNSGLNSSAVRLHQVVLGFLFIFCVGIAALFIIGLLE